MNLFFSVFFMYLCKNKDIYCRIKVGYLYEIH